MNIRAFLRFIRIKYHIFTIHIITIGYLLGSQGSVNYWKLTLLICIFITLYSGLYIVNDVIDLKNDSRNPDKQHSPLVSKKISSKVAIIIAIILLSISSYGSMRLSIDSLPIVGLLIIYNIAYSFLLKQLPWLELFIGGFTHIVRLFLGYIVASGTINLEALFPYIILIYSIGFYVLVEKRLYELPKGKEIRNVLQYYSTKSLTGVRYAVIIATILLLLTIESPLWTIFFAVGIVVLRFISSQKDFYRSFLKVMFG